MANSYFSFKQFTVHQELAAMKVGTDGALLGAWAHVPANCRALDVGTGTGLIALMLAQRGAASVDAVEIDANATEQARRNFAASPWSERLTAIHAPFAAFAEQAQAERYDLIVSNPPYFQHSLQPSDAQRAQARHADALPPHQLLQCALPLLKPNGALCVILPTAIATPFAEQAATLGLYRSRELLVRSKPTASPFRTLMQLERQTHGCNRTKLAIHTPSGDYSPEFKGLLREFYLRF